MELIVTNWRIVKDANLQPNLLASAMAKRSLCITVIWDCLLFGDFMSLAYLALWKSGKMVCIVTGMLLL